jgi:hypothetical protein
MARAGGGSRNPQRTAWTIVLTVPGEREPEIYLVCSAVFGIVGKMLATNQLSSSFGNGPRFEYDEVRFLLTLLGAPRSVALMQELTPIDLWISGE